MTKTIAELDADVAHEERNAGAREAARQVEAGYYYTDEELAEWFDSVETDSPVDAPEIQHRPKSRQWR
jgi:hypothetical protein